MTASTTVVPKKIIVDGCIELGAELELIQATSAAIERGTLFSTGRPRGITPLEYSQPTAGTGELPMQRLSYQLQPTSQTVTIDNDGLCASYGIFGAPGSGKTFLAMNLLRQILALHADQPDRKYGALILDPKAALMEDVRELARAAGREQDLVVLNTDDLRRNNQQVNVIDCGLSSYELGQVLVLAAQAVGVTGSDAFWGISWSNLFSATLYLLNWLESEVVTLRRLLEAIFFRTQDPLEPNSQTRQIQQLAQLGRHLLESLPETERGDAEQAISQIESFFSQDYVGTVEAFITKAYSAFQQSRFACYSPTGQSKDVVRTTFYDRIMEEGTIVLVSVSPSDPTVAKVLCTLVKCLFQQAVLGRQDRVRAGTLTNFVRPLVIACDEYSEVASEVPGQPMGDGHFFSLSRQFGCMGILATQSVNVLQASSLKEAWRSVFSNFGAKVFMRLADNETAEEASKLAGECDWYIHSEGASRSKDGVGSSTQQDLRERKTLPTAVLTQVMRRGQAVVIGSLDGNKSEPTTRFVRVSGPATPPHA